MKFELRILGCSAATPANGLHPTAQVLNVHEQLFLIDCGEGTQMRMLEHSVRARKINHIFISHLHGDHYFGLLGLLTSFALNGRTEPLNIYSPQGLEKLIRPLLWPENEPFPLIFKEVDTNTSTLIFKSKVLEVYSIPLEHRVPTSGYIFKEKKQARKMLKKAIDKYNIPFTTIPDIKNGADFTQEDGSVIPNSELTLDSPSPRSYAYCSDTIYKEDIIPIIQGVNMLYHESTFLHEDIEKAIKTKHTTAFEAAKIALKASAKKLLLGHFSARYKELDPLLIEAKSVFQNTQLAIEGKVYTITN